MTESSSSLSQQLDYKKVNYVHPTYKYNRVLPLSGSQNAIITTAGGTEVLMELPISAMNLSRSILKFTMTPVLLGGAGNYLHVDELSPIRQIQLYTRSGIYLCDLQEVANYTKLVWKTDTKFEEFITNPIVDQLRSSEFLSKINKIAYDGAAPAAAPAYNQQRTQDGGAVESSYTENKYFIKSSVLGAATPVVTLELPLKRLFNTIFSVDKDLYFGEVIIFRIVFNQSSRIYWTTTSATGDPRGADPGAAAAQAIAYAGNVNVSGIELLLRTETNPEIVNQLRSQVLSSGMNILIPYVYTYKNSLVGGTQTVSIRMNRGNGINLVKIYHSVFNSNETVNTTTDNAAGNTAGRATAYDNDNRPYVTNLANTDGAVANFQARSKVLSFYTMLDNNRIQEFDLNTVTFDDYKINKNMFKGTVIQGMDQYYFNWVWIENWSGTEELHSHVDTNKLTGLDLSRERKWDFYATSVQLPIAAGANPAYSLSLNNTNGGSYNHYTFAVTQKNLSVSPQGITVI